jgi:MFS family permease|tara:strand:- start:8790 stop:10022 length:1233 start_codon:yes stop_codon:yes gene_type:complete
LNTPWYYGWNIVGVTLIFQSVLFGSIIFSYTLWVGEWLGDPGLGLTLTYVMVPITILTLAQSVVAPFAGYAMDRYSIRVLVCMGTSSAGLGFILISQVAAFWQIILIYGTLIMAGTVFAGPLAAQTLAAKWFDSHRGLAMGVTTTGTSIGGVFMAPVVTLLYQSFGWRDAHWMLGACFIVVVPLVWFIVRSAPAELVIEADSTSDGSQASTDFRAKTWSTSDVLKEKTFWIIVLSFLPLITASGSIQQHLRPYADLLSIASMQTAVLISVFSTVMIVGKLLFGILADRLDHRALFAMALLACVIVLLGLIQEPSYSALVILSGLLGFSAGGFLPLLGAMVASRFGVASFGSVMGLLAPFLAASAFGPIIFASLFELHGDYQLALWMALMILLPGALAIYYLPSYRKEHKQ